MPIDVNRNPDYPRRTSYEYMMWGDLLRLLIWDRSDPNVPALLDVIECDPLDKDFMEKFRKDQHPEATYEIMAFA